METINFQNGTYLFHWGGIDKLPKVLQKGLYSPLFARRIHDTNYEITRSVQDEDHVYLSPEVYNSYVSTLAVGYVIRKQGTPVGGNFCVRRRIKPRDILGLLVLDRSPAFADTFLADNDVDMWHKHAERQTRQIQQICVDSNTTLLLPIYGTSGEMYYPKRKRRNV